MQGFLAKAVHHCNMAHRGCLMVVLYSLRGLFTQGGTSLKTAPNKVVHSLPWCLERFGTTTVWSAFALLNAVGSHSPNQRERQDLTFL